jgi:hypothetical protein
MPGTGVKSIVLLEGNSGNKYVLRRKRKRTIRNVDLQKEDQRPFHLSANAP